MRYIRLAMLFSILTAMMMGGIQSASAHGAPLKSVQKQVGKYPLRIDYYNDPGAGGALEFSITPEHSSAGNMRYHVVAIPGTFVDAVPVNAVLEPVNLSSGEVHGRVNLPVSGQWLLNLTVEGPDGPSVGDIPVLAGAPPAIPVWLGWVIGLLPLEVLLGFIIWQARSGADRLQQGIAPNSV